jgi:poly-gamma-glutamate synthesis protein (capsule biosynthesis protein)
VAVVFLCGDVMTGRGIDQILPHASAPEIHEPYVQDARDYVALAEQANGPIPRPVQPAYVWGEALNELQRVAPDARIINLETSITRSDDYWKGKGINYRMSPPNAACLTAARIDACALANNHILDYGYIGLEETLQTLKQAGVRTTGAGRDLEAARQPAIVGLRRGGRLVVFSAGTESSGIPPEWAAAEDLPGVDFLDDLSEATAGAFLDRVRRTKRPGDVVVASIHWGGNWGYEVPSSHVQFAHWLLEGGVDFVHGHSSHHPRPIEVYRSKLVLYGCGDFLDDYEGISGYEQFQDDLVLMYFANIELHSGELLRLEMIPMRICRMRLTRASPDEAEWVRATVDRVSRPFGSGVVLKRNGALELCKSSHRVG